MELRHWRGSAYLVDGHTRAVNGVAFLPDGKYVMTGSDDFTIKVWDVDYQHIVDWAYRRRLVRSNRR